MLSFERFAALAASFGADLRRWPDEARGDAEALLRESLPARRLLAEAEEVDAVLRAAGAARDRQVLGSAAGQDAALARLRAGVAARLDAAPRRAASPFQAIAAYVAARFSSPVGMAAGGGVAVAAGLVAGWLGTAPPQSDPVTALLQPVALQLFPVE